MLEAMVGRGVERAAVEALKAAVGGELTGVIGDRLARVLVKGVDALVAWAVKNDSPAGTPADRGAVAANAYVAVVEEQLRQLVNAVRIYVPLQVAVEVAKRQFGGDSAEANAARGARRAGIAGVQEEVRDVLAAAAGRPVAD